MKQREALEKKCEKKRGPGIKWKITSSVCWSNFVVPIHSESLVPVAASFGAATPVGASAAIPSRSALWPSVLVLARWGWADKGIVDMKRLFEELVTIQVLDGFTGLGESGVFDQCVALPEY